jgi:hypothetical protein
LGRYRRDIDLFFADSNLNDSTNKTKFQPAGVRRMAAQGGES